jgi:hypothetical protein
MMVRQDVASGVAGILFQGKQPVGRFAAIVARLTVNMQLAGSDLLTLTKKT